MIHYYVYLLHLSVGSFGNNLYLHLRGRDKVYVHTLFYDKNVKLMLGALVLMFTFLFLVSFHFHIFSVLPLYWMKGFMFCFLYYCFCNSWIPNLLIELFAGKIWSGERSRSISSISERKNIDIFLETTEIKVTCF